MQFATSAVVPWPSGPLSALQIDSGELNATPVTPRPLFAVAVIVPATWVPWPLSSRHEPEVIRPATDWPQSTVLPARSSWVWVIPVSTIPTLTPPLCGKAPIPATSQPSGASMSASATPPVWPVLLRPYSSRKRGSFGVAKSCIGRSTSAYSTSARRLRAAAAAAGSPVVRTTRAPRAWIVSPSRAPEGIADVLALPGANLTMTWPSAAEAGAATSRTAASASRALRKKGGMFITNASMPRTWRVVAP